MAARVALAANAMTIVSLPRACTQRSLADVLAESRALDADWERLLVLLPDKSFVSTGAIALLTSWGLLQRQRGAELAFQGHKETMRYLARMDVFRHLEFEYRERFERHAEAGRFIPAKLVQDADSVRTAVDSICDLVLHQFDNASEFLPALEWATQEIVDNIRNHAAATVPGVVCAQYFPTQSRIEIGISDMGQGIRASLSARYDDLLTDSQAVRKAFQAGVTRDPEIGQGNGLAGSLEIVKANGGDLCLWTGKVSYEVKKGRAEQWHPFQGLPGTGVLLALRTNNPVDLRKTSIVGERDWTFVDVERERASHGGLLVREECANTAGREAAIPLRRKVRALLDAGSAEPGEPVVLDFTGVRTPSSSFLDELLGRLAVDVGEPRFRAEVRLAGTSDLVEGLAGKVIRQRLAEGSASRAPRS